MMTLNSSTPARSSRPLLWKPVGQSNLLRIKLYVYTIDYLDYCILMFPTDDVV